MVGVGTVAVNFFPAFPHLKVRGGVGLFSAGKNGQLFNQIVCVDATRLNRRLHRKEVLPAGQKSGDS